MKLGRLKRCGGGGEAYVRLAEENLKGPRPNAGFAAHWIGVGREELKRTGGRASRLEELHRRMLDLQAKHVKTARPIDLPDGLSKPPTKRFAAYSQQPGNSYLVWICLRLSFDWRSISPRPMSQHFAKKEMEEGAQKFVFTALLGETVVSSDGRPLGYLLLP